MKTRASVIDCPFDFALIETLRERHFDASNVRDLILAYASQHGTVDGCEFVEDAEDRQACNTVIAEYTALFTAPAWLPIDDFEPYEPSEAERADACELFAHSRD